MNTRIDLDDTIMDIICKLSGGNPGAMNVMMQMLAQTGTIDPNHVLGGAGAVMALDTLNVYESKIWVLYKEICNEDLVTMLGLMRGVQLGYMHTSELTEPLSTQHASIPAARIAEVLAMVRERLPAFAK